MEEEQIQGKKGEEDGGLIEMTGKENFASIISYVIFFFFFNFS